MQDLSTELRLAQAHRQTRRHFLSQCQTGLGAIALASCADRSTAQESGSAPHNAQTTPPSARIKRVIYLHMAGGPPQHELFDYKPKLVQHHLQPCPDELLKQERFAFIKGHPLLLGTPYKFAQHGQSGAWVSELLPNFSQIVDDVCLIRSMHTDQFNHAPAELFIFTGSPRFGGASMGSWITYGLGSESDNLPGFVVLVSGGTDPTGGKALWSSGFLPSVYQGVQCRSKGEPVLYVSDPPGWSRETRRRSLDALEALNRQEFEQFGDPETQTRISQYELAFRMQMSVPDVMDLNRETAQTLSAYGAEPGAGSFANNCLLARRLVERGVRFVQLFDWGWDCHGTGKGDDIVHHLPNKCRQVDQPIAALVRDLKQRGLLEETLIVWGGEFGRTAMNEARDGSKFLGRDHHPHCYSIWMTGGGIRRGVTVGSTDELGYHVTEEPFTVRDLQATILHLLGLDPWQFSFTYQGLRNRLIGPAGEGRLHPTVLA